MLSATRRNRFGPPLILLGSAVLMSLAITPLTSSTIGPALAAGPYQPGAAVSCLLTPAAAGRAAMRHDARTNAAAIRHEKLNGNGELVGRDVAIHAANGRDDVIDLPVESFIAQPSGDALVYTRVVGGHSEIHVVDLAVGCDTLVARPREIARSALIGLDGTSVYVHSVTAKGRADAGVTRYPLDGGDPELVVPPLPDDDTFGVTFGTQLAWGTDGATLAAQSCAIDQCRTRLLDLATDEITMYDAPGQGELVGVSAAHVVAFAACTGLPCAVISVDRGAGTTRVLAAEAWSAALTNGPGDTAVVSIETSAGTVEIDQ